MVELKTTAAKLFQFMAYFDEGTDFQMVISKPHVPVPDGVVALAYYSGTVENPFMVKDQPITLQYIKGNLYIPELYMENAGNIRRICNLKVAAFKTPIRNAIRNQLVKQGVTW